MCGLASSRIVKIAEMILMFHIVGNMFYFAFLLYNYSNKELVCFVGRLYSCMLYSYTTLRQGSSVIFGLVPEKFFSDGHSMAVFKHSICTIFVTPYMCSFSRFCFMLFTPLNFYTGN